MQHANDELDPATASLWFAGKQLLPKNQLSHHLGRHEKTKAVIKLQQAGQGAPAREAVSSSTGPYTVMTARGRSTWLVLKATIALTCGVTFASTVASCHG